MLLTRSAVLTAELPQSARYETRSEAPNGVLRPAESDPVAIYLESLAPGSRRTMRAAVRLVATLLTGTGDVVAVPWHAVTFAHAMTVRSALATRYAPATANKILAALRGVMRAAFQIGHIHSDQLARVNLVKAVRGSRVARGRALSTDELRALFTACRPDSAAGARDAALLALLYAGGLRRSEVVSLDVGDFDPLTRRLLVHGKGARERTLFIGTVAAQVVHAWLVHRGRTAGPLLVPVNRADRVVHRRMTDQALADRLRVLQERAGVAHFTAHDCRRTFVSNCLDLGVDLATVQATVGHASPMTTSRYDRRFDLAKQRAATLHDVPPM